MIKNDVSVKLPQGLQARPVAGFVQLAGQYDSNVYVTYRNKTANAKSIMGMMSLGVAWGDTVSITCEGPDEEEALTALDNYLSERG